MKFDHVINLLRSYRTPDGEKILFLLQEAVMRDIYDCVVGNRAQDCLELGTGYGTTSCVIAAALDELGRGQITTVDMSMRGPIGVYELANHVGLSSYVDVVCDEAGYNWYLADIIKRQMTNGLCKPCLDFCFLDGAHEWTPDALATFLVARLLRPGAWLALDDLDFKLRGSQPGWERAFAGRTERELDSRQVSMVFDLVLRQHSDFGNFSVTGGGRTGWAQKKFESGGMAPNAWKPAPDIVPDEVELAWSKTFEAKDIAWAAHRSSGIRMMERDGAVVVQAVENDPAFILPSAICQGRTIDFISLRMRLLASSEPGVLQVFWTEAEGEPFSEARSVRVELPPSEDWADIAIRLSRADEPGPVWGIRFDPTDGPSHFLWDNLTVGRIRSPHI